LIALLNLYFKLRQQNRIKTVGKEEWLKVLLLILLLNRTSPKTNHVQIHQTFFRHLIFINCHHYIITYFYSGDHYLITHRWAWSFLPPG
jgi:hypothetical protein